MGFNLTKAIGDVRKNIQLELLLSPIWTSY